MVKCGPVALVIFGASVLTVLYGLYAMWSGHSAITEAFADPAKLLESSDCDENGENCKAFKPAWGARKEFTVDPGQFSGSSLIGGYLFIKKDSGKDCSAVFKGLTVQNCKDDDDCTKIEATSECGQASYWSDYTEVASFSPFLDDLWKVTSSEEGVYFFDSGRYTVTKAVAGAAAWVAAILLAMIPLGLASCCCCCAVIACLVTPSEGTAAREPMQMQLA